MLVFQHLNEGMRQIQPLIHIKLKAYQSMIMQRWLREHFPYQDNDEYMDKRAPLYSEFCVSTDEMEQSKN